LITAAKSQAQVSHLKAFVLHHTHSLYSMATEPTEGFIQWAISCPSSLSTICEFHQYFENHQKWFQGLWNYREWCISKIKQE